MISPITPTQQLFFYESAAWETFVYECIKAMNGRYLQVKMVGGSGDRGLDVIGLCDQQGLDGTWDCYQCKHYTDPLTPSNAYPEILKVIAGALDGVYRFPRRYYFVAPQGCGTTLSLLLSSPSALKTKFLEKFDDAKSPLASGLPAPRRAQLRAYAEQLNFEQFKSFEVDELLDLHKTTEYFYGRFGQRLPSRPEDAPPPTSPAATEARYVAKLVQIYKEKREEITCVEELDHDAKLKTHFQRQRESFYSAESLRMFARDSLPETEYKRLQRNVYDGVIETCEADYDTGLNRLRYVLDAASALPLSSGLLGPVTETRDKKGICHQLANDDLLDWGGVQEID